MANEIKRRDMLRLMAGTAATALVPPLTGCDGTDGSDAPAATPLPFPSQQDFTAVTAPADSWGAQWINAGVANLRTEAGVGVLEAGTDIFPNDPRPVAYLLDARALDAKITAAITATGRQTGLVLRRQNPNAYYAAVLDADSLALRILRRQDFQLDELASTPLPPTALPGLLAASGIELSFEAAGKFPTQLKAKLTGAEGLSYEVSASDSSVLLQQPGDPGVLTRADTLFPDTNPVLPALGNIHLAPYAVQEGQVVTGGPVGEVLFGTIRQRSTAKFTSIRVESSETPAATPASVMAATTGLPLDGGFTLQIASDLPAQVRLELSQTQTFSTSTIIDAGMTGAFNAVAKDIIGLAPGTWFWRPQLLRSGLVTLGPTRQFRVLPRAQDAGAAVVIQGSCGSQFNAIYDHIATRQPDIFIWQGDLNYPDAYGPLAQTMAVYAGSWRHFLDNPRLVPILQRAAFVAGRDDHDYAIQDARAATLLPWGVAPWESLMNPRTFSRFTVMGAEFWNLDQRKYKDDPALPDTPEKTLLGAGQRAWLLETLAGSAAPFKIICSPATVAPSGVANTRDGSWAAGFTAERDLILAHLREHVSGQIIFLTGDTHFTMLWDQDGLYEQRACPLDIPVPNDTSIANPDLELTFGNTPGVVYWSRRSHFTCIRLQRDLTGDSMTVELVRDDGAVVQSRTFTSPLSNL